MLSEEGRGFGVEAIDTLSHSSRIIEIDWLLSSQLCIQNESIYDSNPDSRAVSARKSIHFQFFQMNLWILKNDLNHRSIPFQPELEVILQQTCDGLYRARAENFGNAGEIRNLVDTLERRRVVRMRITKAETDAPLTEEDIPDEYRTLRNTKPLIVDDILAELIIWSGWVRFGSI
jgi:hypothetical protein